MGEKKEQILIVHRLKVSKCGAPTRQTETIAENSIEMRHLCTAFIMRRPPYFTIQSVHTIFPFFLLYYHLSMWKGTERKLVTFRWMVQCDDATHTPFESHIIQYSMRSMSSLHLYEYIVIRHTVVVFVFHYILVYFPLSERFFFLSNCRSIFIQGRSPHVSLLDWLGQKFE